MPHPSARISRVDTADDRGFFDHRQDFEFTNFHRDGIGVAVGHQAAGRTMAGHAKTARVINDDQVCAAAFDEFGADTGTGAGSDNSFARFERVTEALDDFFPGIRVTFSSPGIGHDVKGVSYVKNQSVNAGIFGGKVRQLQPSKAAPQTNRHLPPLAALAFLHTLS